MDLIDYDNMCEAIGVRVQDGDHLVSEAVGLLNKCDTLEEAHTMAGEKAAEMAAARRYLAALIYDTIENQIEGLMEDAEDE